LIIYDPLDDFGDDRSRGSGAIVEMGEEVRWAGMWGVGGREGEREEGRLKFESINGRRERKKERTSTVDCQ